MSEGKFLTFIHMRPHV